jgi:hypothetical protein
MDEQNTQTTSPNTTDQAILRCEEIIAAHSKKARTLLVVILSVSTLFLTIVSMPFIKQYLLGDRTITIVGSGSDNNYIRELNDSVINNSSQYDSLISKAITFQKLLNAKNEQDISFRKSIEKVEKVSFSDYISYSIFILFFGVFTSFYRFHMKEISKQEHYLIGFQRIRIAGVNSKTKYDDEVKIALTKNAFYYESDVKNLQTKKKLESPIQGHPASDLSTVLINKMLDKFDFKPKE